jgi:hypothetical protein
VFRAESRRQRGGRHAEREPHNQQQVELGHAA